MLCLADSRSTITLTEETRPLRANRPAFPGLPHAIAADRPSSGMDPRIVALNAFSISPARNALGPTTTMELDPLHARFRTTSRVQSVCAIPAASGRDYDDFVSGTENPSLSRRVCTNPSAVDHDVDLLGEDRGAHGSNLPIQTHCGIGVDRTDQCLETARERLDVLIERQLGVLRMPVSEDQTCDADAL